MSKTMAHLIPVKENVSGDPIKIPSNGLVVGREDECDHVIIGDGISRFHATFFWEGDTLLVEDMDSTNGVSVNGRLVDKRSKIVPGDLIQICTFDFLVGGPVEKVAISATVRVSLLATLLLAMVLAIALGARMMSARSGGKTVGTGSLSILSSPTGAEIYDHGKKVGQTPYVFKNLTEGKYRLMLRMSGHRDKEVNMVVPQGGTRKIHALDPILIGEGHLLIRSLPAGAKVFVDDKPVGTTALGSDGEAVSAPLRVPNVNLDVEHRVYMTYEGNKSVTYLSEKYKPDVEVILWAPDRVLLKRTGDVLLGMLRKKEADGTIELAVSRTATVRVPAIDISEFRTVLPPVFKQNQGVTRRKDASGVLELIIDPFPDDEE